LSDVKFIISKILIRLAFCNANTRKRPTNEQGSRGVVEYVNELILLK